MRRILLAMLTAVSLVAARPAVASDCELRCKFLIVFTCARVDLTCSGTLSCRNGECWAWNGLASCREGIHGNWYVTLDCGSHMPAVADEPTASKAKDSLRWEVVYRQPGEEIYTRISSSAAPLLLSREEASFTFEPGTDVAIRACPGKLSEDKAESEGVRLDLEAGVPADLAPGLAVGTVTLVDGAPALKLLAVESRATQEVVEKALTDLLLSPFQKPGPFWFTVMWKDGKIDGAAMDL